MNKFKDNWKAFQEYNKEAWTKAVTEWKSWVWQEHVAQCTWLVILVALFYYGTHGVIASLKYASEAGVDPNGPIGILLTFIIFVPVIAIFVAHWLYSKFVHFLFTKFAK